MLGLLTILYAMMRTSLYDERSLLAQMLRGLPTIENNYHQIEGVFEHPEHPRATPLRQTTPIIGGQI